MTCMSTPQGAVAPYQGTVVQGEAIKPAAILDPISPVAHGFLNVIRELVRGSGVFREETALLEALRAVDNYARQHIPRKDQQHVVREHDVAPVEDVRLRQAPQTGVVPVPSGMQQIDYALLAQYIVAAQQQAAGQPQEPQVITDAPEKSGQPQYTAPPPAPQFNPNPSE